MNHPAHAARAASPAEAIGGNQTITMSGLRAHTRRATLPNGRRQLKITENRIEPMLNAADAAAVLATTTGQLANMRCNGVGPDYCRIGSALRYRVSALNAYIEANTVKVAG